MDETQWDIQEVKHLKKKQLVQNNLVMLLLFVLIAYFAYSGKHSLINGIYFVLIWINVAITLYTLKKGRTIGTKTSKRVQEFDRNRLGEKRWKRNRITEAVIISVTGIGIAVLLFVVDFNSVRLDVPNYVFPFIGAWIGFNIREIIRMNNL
jgi:Ca2+/Na+ antiporter